MELWSGGHLIDTDVTWSADGKVIVIKDQEYIKTCGEQVTLGGYSVMPTYCVKGVDHITPHEDRNGRFKYDLNKVREDNWAVYDDEFRKAVMRPSPVIAFHQDIKRSNPIDIKWFMVGALTVIPLWLIFVLLAFRAQ
jgi:hypothetical protein